MDWTKIKTKHFLFNNTSYTQKGYLAAILCYIAHLERKPSFEEIQRNLSKSCCDFAVNLMQICGISYEDLTEKVLEDVGKLHKKRNRDRSYHYTYDKSRQRGTAASSSPREEKIREDKRRTIVSKPTLEDVKKYFAELNFSAESERFFNYYEANGWTQGRGKAIKNWKAAARNWVGNTKSYGGKKDLPNQNKKDREQLEQWKKEAAPMPEEAKVALSKLFGGGNVKA
jgi:hypothetical protein